MDEVKEIANIYVGKLKRRMERRANSSTSLKTALDLMTEKGFSPTYGARFLKRFIDQKVKLPLTNQWKASTRFVVDAEDGEITVKPIDAFSLN
ncbi:MAG: hypothetical protein IPJ30_28080 [Acidobacteria bacterium]|nr:hypothetical protein [Acidobacteriota bacterium]